MQPGVGAGGGRLAGWLARTDGRGGRTSRPWCWPAAGPGASAGTSWPLAGVAAGVVAVTTDLVLVLAGDMPRAVGAVPSLLVALDADPSAGAAMAVDDDGRANPLLALYRLDALRAALPEDPADMPAKRLLALSHTGVRVAGRSGRDVDTPEDLARLRHDV